MRIKDFLLLLDSILKIYKSDLFDKKWYIENYNDLSKAYKIFPAIHYSLYGWREGRNAGPKFNTITYIEKYSDVKTLGINPLYHYEKYGKYENRNLNVEYKKNIQVNKSEIYKMVYQSKLFDMQWYSNNYLYTHPTVSSVSSFVTRIYDLNPGPAFNTNEYKILNKDIGNIAPFVHYEEIGKYEDRGISFADIVFQNNMYEIEKCILFKNREKELNNIISVFYVSHNGLHLTANLMLLLKALSDISDFVVVVSDADISDIDTKKLQSACNVLLIDSKCNDSFMAYKKGYNYIKDEIIRNDDSIIFMNHLNIGPIYQLDCLLNIKKDNKFDICGLHYKQSSINRYLEPNFYMINKTVYESELFNNFMNNLYHDVSYANNYYYNGLLLYNILEQLNVKIISIIPENIIIKNKLNRSIIDEYKIPFITQNMLFYLSNYEKNSILSYIKQLNQSIDINIDNIINITTNSKKYIPPYSIYNNYSKKLLEIQRKYLKHKKINIYFLVNMVSMFPAEEVMCKFLNDANYSVKLVIIPDIRFGNIEMYKIYNQAYNELSKKYSNILISAVEIDDTTFEIKKWTNPFYDADIICYPSPYNVSYSVYNPYYAVQAKILSFIINYGYFRSKFDRFIYNLDNYNYIWKVFLETNINYEEYKKYGRCDAENSVVVGYAKMDRYAKYQYKQVNERKKIILAPHYSVNENTNRLLMLSNFEKYGDLFLELPTKYPEIDFIFRPHPVLFTTLRKENFWGEKKVEDYIGKMISHKNVVYSTEGDYLEIFASSDGIIQDCGSFLVEYLYTGKPCCYMLKSKNDIQDKFNELGIKCLEHTYIAYNEDEIITFIEDVIIKENDYMKKDRIAFAEKEIMVNYPNVSMKIYEYINNLCSQI